MKSIGIVREIDQLGRIVIPKELRKVYDIAEGEHMEILTEGDAIILRKFNRSCVFCGEGDDLVNYKGKFVCRSCLGKLNDKSR